MTTNISVSGPMLRQLFHPCTEEFIRGVCHGRCCQGTGRISVAVHPGEEDAIRALGATVSGGLIAADDRGLCPFKDDSGLCQIHDKGKPFGCSASPFTVTPNRLLIVRNRYRLLKCYRCAGAIPAYEAHAASLSAILGQDEARRVAQAAASGEGRIAATIDEEKLAILWGNTNTRKAAR